MHAVVIREGQLHWEERDDPVPGDTELLVAVRAAGLNAADLVQRAGFYPAPPGWPADIPGMEFAGEVVAVGRQVTLFAPGDRVMAVVGGGAQATHGVRRRVPCAPCPRRPVVDRSGRASPRSSPPPTTRLFRQAELQMGERVLVSGAAGGVGTAAVQLAAPGRCDRDGHGARPRPARGGGRAGCRRGAGARRRGRRRPLRRRARAGGRAQPDQRAAAHGDLGPGRGDRRRRRGAHGGRAHAADAEADPHRRLHPARPQPPREGRRGRRRGGARAAGAAWRGACRSRSTRRSRSPRRRRPTNTSPPAPSSARWCSSPRDRGRPLRREQTLWDFDASQSGAQPACGTPSVAKPTIGLLSGEPP